MSGDTLRGVPRPRTGETPQHNVRVAAGLWNAAVAKAHAEGTTLSKVIVAFLQDYVGPDHDADRIRKIVDGMPPLTDEQITRLVALLRSGQEEAS